MFGIKDSLANEEEFFPGVASSVLDLAPSGIFIFDLKKKQHTYVNQQQINITGYSLAELQQMAKQGYEKMFHPDEEHIYFLSTWRNSA